MQVIGPAFYGRSYLGGRRSQGTNAVRQARGRQRLCIGKLGSPM